MPKEIKEVKLPGVDEPVVLASVVSAPKAPEPAPAPEPTIPAPTIKHHFIAGSIAAGIILAVILLIWVTVKVVPAIFSGSASFVATTLNSTFIPADNGASTTKPAKNSDNTSPSNNTPAPIIQNYYGNSDLSVSLIATGIIDPVSKQFIATNYAGGNDEIAIKFQVKNIGTNVSGPWTLRLTMPSRTTPIYDSNQQSIRPGDRIEFVGSFNSPVNVGINTGYIIADPFNAVSESSEGNNNLTVSFNINSPSYNYNNNYNYGTSYNNGYYNNGYYNNYPVNYNYGQLYTWTNIIVNCYANPQTATRGAPITWYATASGGNGYFTYYWTGDDNLYSTSNAVGHVYYTQGNKFATVAVTSGGQTVTAQCSTVIY